jgi:hypothetical protein
MALPVVYRRKVQSWGPRELNALERRERGDGSGDVVFRTDMRSGSKGTTITRHGFYGIARAREVEAMIGKLRDAAR